LSELNLSFLGSPHIARSQTGNITFPKRKALALLAYLVIESEHSHSRESLLGLFWPELPTAAAQNNLRVVLSQLRKGMGEESDDSQPYLIGKRFDLGFNPHSDYTLDVTLFLDLVAATRAHQHSNRPDCSECAERLAQAIELVRGEFLEGFSLGDAPAFDEWLFVQRERLHLQITAALEELGTFHERAGNSADAETYVRRLLEFDPLRESAHCQLMRLLADAGQRSAALNQYETCRRLLANELGVAPAPETVLLAEQIRALAPTQTTSQGPRHNLPPALTRFIGRSAESARLQELLTRESGGVLTLTGPGGVGKTRLALQVAHDLANRFSDGVWLVELAGVQDASAVPAAVASALNVVPDARRSLTRMIGDYLRGKSILLVFDNCEHLLEACSQLVTALRLAAPNLAVLATSRTPLRLDEERVVRLRPFPSPVMDSSKTLTVADALQYDSIQLFSNCAAQSLLSFTLDDSNAGSVAQICRNLDGIPLAIELAAARAGSMPVEAIAQRLDQRFRWLDSKTPGKLPRQRTLHALIDWSYDLLDEQEKALFCRLAVFAGGWTLEAAETVSEDEDACADILGRLVDQSLVVFGDDPDRRRYRMHESIHQFALEKLSEMGEEVKTVVYGQHSQTYLTLLASHTDAFWGRTPRESIRIIQRDLDNVRQAWQWALAEHQIGLLEQSASGLARFYVLAGLYEEGWGVFSKAVQIIETLRDSAHAETKVMQVLHARLLTELSDFAMQMGKIEEAVLTAERALSAAGQAGDPGGEARACSVLGMNQITLGHNDLALPILERGLAGTRIAGMTTNEGILLRYIGNVWRQRGDLDREREFLQKALSLQQKAGYLAEEQTVLIWLAFNSHRAARFSNARDYLMQAEKLNTLVGDTSRISKIESGMGVVAAALGQYETARKHFQHVLDLSRQLGDLWMESYILFNLASVNGRLGNEEEAFKEVRAALTAAEEGQFGELAASATIVLGYLLTFPGRRSEAIEAFNSARTQWRTIGRKASEVEAAVGLAGVLFESGDDVRARELVSEVMEFINDKSLQGTEHPIQIYLTCYRILHAGEDCRAESLLVRAFEQMQSIATAIEDETLQKSFLENVPAHRELMQIWQARKG
jgi:predicted ATPase/DNA-binding SARP family transcriptional activator